MKLIYSFLLVCAIFLPACKSRPEVTTPANDIQEQIQAGLRQQRAMQTGNNEQMLRDAALNGNTATVKKLLSENTKADVTDEDGRNALMLASYNGHTEISRLLLDAGTDVNLKDNYGRTALMFASSGPFSETVSLLLSHRADPDLTDQNDHFTALMFAASEGQSDVVRILLENHANPYLKDVDGDDAVTFAKNNHHDEVVKILKSLKK